eukprot:2771352-Prymnesium_polylepis.1
MQARPSVPKHRAPPSAPSTRHESSLVHKSAAWLPPRATELKELQQYKAASPHRSAPCRPSSSSYVTTRPAEKLMQQMSAGLQVLHAGSSGYRVPAAYNSGSTPHHSKTISMHVKELHAHVGALEARIAALQTQNITLESRAGAFEQALQARLVKALDQDSTHGTPHMQREANVPEEELPGAGGCSAAPPSVKCVLFSPRAEPPASCGADANRPASPVDFVQRGPKRVPLTGWRGNLQSEMQNKTLITTNARLRREADKAAREMAAVRDTLGEAEQRAAQAEAHVAELEQRQQTAAAAFEKRERDERERAAAAVREMLLLLQEVHYDTVRLEALLERFVASLADCGGAAPLSELLRAMVEQAREEEARSPAQRRPYPVDSDSSTDGEALAPPATPPVAAPAESPARRTWRDLKAEAEARARADAEREKLRLYAEIEKAVARARRALSKTKDREEKEEQDARQRRSQSDASFGVAPTRRSVQNARNAVTAEQWVASTGAVEAIAHVLVARLPERTVDRRIEGAFLVELGKASGMEVLESLFAQADLLPKLCGKLWDGLGELNVAVGDVPLRSAVWSHMPTDD